MRKWTLVMLASSLLIVLWAPSAQAHSGDQSYLYLDVTDAVRAELHLPFADIGKHLDIVIEGSDDEIDAIIADNADKLISYAREHFSVGTVNETWSLTNETLSRLGSNVYVVVRFDVDVDPDAVPDTLKITLDPFFDEDNNRDALFLIANDWQRGYVNNEADPLARFTSDDRTNVVEIGDRSWTRNLSSSLGLGIDHIKTGPDHILFVAVLLLPSVLAFNNGWVPGASFARSLWRVLKIVSMFTVAHSITFTLAGLSIIPLPGPRLVESIIALSIAAAALHNLRPIAPQREWIIAFSFGLFHGLGFASLVEDLQIGRSTRLVSLLGRNLGIEIGQAVVVLAVFPALFLLRRTTYYMPFFRLASAGLIVISLGWVTERLFDAPPFATRAVRTVIVWPRVIWFVAAFTVFAMITYAVQNRKESLLSPVAIEEPSEV